MVRSSISHLGYLKEQSQGSGWCGGKRVVVVTDQQNPGCCGVQRKYQKSPRVITQLTVRTHIITWTVMSVYVTVTRKTDKTSFSSSSSSSKACMFTLKLDSSLVRFSRNQKNQLYKSVQFEYCGIK